MADPWADAEVTLRDMLSHRTGLKAKADLAGEVLGSAYHSSWENVIQTQIFVPLGMTAMGDQEIELAAAVLIWLSPLEDALAASRPPASTHRLPNPVRMELYWPAPDLRRLNGIAENF